MKIFELIVYDHQQIVQKRVHFKLELFQTNYWQDTIQ